MNYKKWLFIFFIIIIMFALISSTIIYIIDPYFHFHAPVEFLKYNFANKDNERYINNGILRNFDYDAVITGTSHNENFNAFEFNELLNCNSVKVPLSGAEYKEIAEQFKCATKYNDHIKYVLYGINFSDILHDKDASDYDNYPTYLYDDDISNDYKYLFSGHALIHCLNNIVYTLNKKNITTTFDNYAHWDNGEVNFSKDAVLSKYTREIEKIESQENLTEKEKNICLGNINENVIDIAKANPNITFYFFLAPHNIVWWDSISQKGKLLKYFEAEELLINSLLELDNVKLYSFFNNYDLICNLDNYMDLTHYRKEVNSQILKWMKNDEFLLTKENKDEYLNKERQFYLNYNYDALFLDV